MKLEALIPLLPSAPVISIAGAGGKTTLMYRLAEMLPGPCVMTTTTKVGEDQIMKADGRYTPDEFPPSDPLKRMWLSPSLIPENGKICGFSLSGFSRIAACCRKSGFALVNEADGAARRHIKAPADQEPVIPSESDVCFYAVGLDVLGERLDDVTVHRPELLSQITGYLPDSVIDEDCILRLFDHNCGGLKNMPEKSIKIAYMNHADTAERRLAADHIAANLKNYDHVCIHA